MSTAGALVHSLYVRIAVSFVVFVIAVVIAQSVMFSYVLSRSPWPFPGRSPNTVAAMAAADLGATLTEDPAVDLQQYVAREYGRLQFHIYAVMKDGRVAANTPTALPEPLRRSMEEVLAATDFKRTGGTPALNGPPLVTAPIQVAHELRGMVVVPPAPRGAMIVRDLGRALSIPGTAVLIAGTTVAAFFIFGPARRRLRVLEAAAARLGSGDLAARAPEGGGDEIAHLAAVFNRMAGELAARDDALRTSDRLRRQMLADVSHELKTPLTAMRGYVETLRMAEVALDADTRDRYFATVERETLRLDRIVRDLLDLARLENGVGALDARLFAIQRVFEHVSERHRCETTARRIAVRAHVDDEADQVFGNPDRLEQVIENLFANAVRHTPEGGAVELRAAALGGAVVLSVIDSGPGIPPEHVSHVFERFYKVDAARANGAEGSGLGLSIAKAIVERHRGTIHVTSVPGQTVFTVTLPQEIEQVDRPLER
jgi:signal transduction histidine kinase